MELTEQTGVPSAALPLQEFKDHLRLGTGFADDTVQDALAEAYLRAAMAAHASADGLDRLDAAYALAKTTHRHNRRYSGDPYVVHPLAVAHLLAVWDEPGEVVLAGLLHDVLDDGAQREDVVRVAGPYVLRLVVAVNRMHTEPGGVVARDVRRLRLVTPFGRQVAMVKLADRLHNARTWGYLPPHKARTKAINTLQLLTPMASALGLAAVERELSELSYRTLGGVAVGDSCHVMRAVALLPATERDRWSTEWEADLAHLPPGRERLVFGLGLLWSALTIRADHLRRSTGTAPRRP